MLLQRLRKVPIVQMDLSGKTKPIVLLKCSPHGATSRARGKMARNMRPAHAVVASGRGSLNVGRFYFRVKVDTGQIFDIYYDRAMKNVDDRKGQWFIYRELGEET